MIRPSFNRNCDKLSQLKLNKDHLQCQNHQNEESKQKNTLVKNIKCKSSLQSKDKRLSLQIKDYKVKFNNLKSFSQNKLKKRRNSILSNIYRPLSQNRSQNEVVTFLNEKNMSLIKNNIKKLQICLPYQIPSLLKNQSKKRMFNNSFKQICKTERQSARQLTKNDVFLFNTEVQIDSILSKRRVNCHFDRSKYFNCQNFKKKDSFKNLFFHSRQKTLQNINSKIANKKLIKKRTKQNISYIQYVEPIAITKSQKPKTAGGFLKKYGTRQICERPDFELQIAQNQDF